MGTFTMPSLGADMDSGRLTEWLVAPGDVVKRGQIIAVVDTAKSAIEVEVFEDGAIGELLVEPGTEVPVGTPLATIVAGGLAPEGPMSGAAAESTADAAVGAAESGELPRTVSEPGAAAGAVESPHDPLAESEPSASRISRLASPPVRHLAHQLGVDIESIRGSGRGGRVTRQDVQQAADSITAPAPPRRITPRARRLAQQRGVDLSALPSDLITGSDIPAEQPPQSPPQQPQQRKPEVGATQAADRRDTMRLATARLMARSAREIPHYYVASTIDVAAMTSWLAAHNASLPVRQRVLPIAVLLRAVCVAAVAVPQLNGHWIDEAFIPGEGVHLGVATATRGGGLVTPALRDADSLDVDGLMAALTDLTRRARKGSLRSSEITPGTLTVSSLADGGPDALFGVIYPPQVALVGVGVIAQRPWSIDGMLTVRPVVTITLAADHRATDGRTGAAFLAAMAQALAHPEEL